jgi:hypothetical protein
MGTLEHICNSRPLQSQKDSIAARNMIKSDLEKVQVFKYLLRHTDKTDLAHRVIFACAYLDLMWCQSNGLQDMERVGPWRLSHNTIAAEYMIGF